MEAMGTDAIPLLWGPSFIPSTVESIGTLLERSVQSAGLAGRKSDDVISYKQVTAK